MVVAATISCSSSEIQKALYTFFPLRTDFDFDFTRLFLKGADLFDLNTT
jgi:hypothetical protein